MVIDVNMKTYGDKIGDFKPLRFFRQDRIPCKNIKYLRQVKNKITQDTWLDYSHKKLSEPFRCIIIYSPYNLDRINENSNIDAARTGVSRSSERIFNGRAYKWWKVAIVGT